jgi:ABC-type multidrug transport system ATPase subunit/pSer/pThr/pTyr-binding forkhead associated (FHA) protein
LTAASDGRDAASVAVDHGNEHLTFEPGQEASIGRARDARVHISDVRVSRLHAVLRHDPNDGWVLEDAGSKAGLFVDGRRIERLILTGSTAVHLADPRSGPVLTLTVSRPTTAPARRTEATQASPSQALKASEVDKTASAALPTIRIGRGSGSQIAVDDLLVSRHHAELTRTTNGWRLKDLGSRNGSFVNGQRIEEADLSPGQRVTFGQADFIVMRGGLAPWPVDDYPSLEAAGLTVRIAKGPVLLDSISFSISPNSLIAVLGPTGSGKSTLLRTLTGSLPPDSGTVLYAGHDLYREYDSTLRRVGYVPQDDILHPELTVWQTLRFGAELRFPVEVSKREREERIGELMEELGLTHRADVQVSKLSGGQRKRTSVALELLTKPAVLFLDEPTSGLDPGFEKSVMQLLRQLADGGRTVVVVTHSIQSLSLCDRVLFLGTGGTVAYFGPPKEAVAYFGESDLADVFHGLETGQMAPIRLSGSWVSRRDQTSVAPFPPAPQVRWRRQLWMLLKRQLAILVADRRVAAYLLAELLIPALLILALVGRHALNAAKGGAGSAQTLIGAIVVAAAVIGAANGVREIVKESALYGRERAVGLSRSAYLFSKILLIGLVTAIQVALLTFIATRGSDGPGVSNLLRPPVLELTVDVALAAIAAVGLGLLISSLVSSSEKAMALIPVIFVVQWLFSGMVLNLQSKPVLKQAAYATSANWGLAASASTVDLCGIQGQQHGPPPRAPVRGAPSSDCEWRWRHDTAPWTVDVLALGGLILVSMMVADRLLRRKEPARHLKRSVR